MIKIIHSYWAYLVLLVLLLAVFKSLTGYFGKKDYDAKAFRVSLFTLIVSHIQLLIGLLLYFTSERFGLWSDLGRRRGYEECEYTLIPCRTSNHKYFSRSLDYHWVF